MAFLFKGVNFDEGGKLEYFEENLQSQLRF